MSALDRQVGGDHYKKMSIQPWEAIRAWLSPEQFQGYMLGTALAYLARVNSTGSGKGGVTDAAKALHTLEFLFESTDSGDSDDDDDKDDGLLPGFAEFLANARADSARERFLRALRGEGLPPRDDPECAACHGGAEPKVNVEARVLKITPSGAEELSLDDLAADGDTPPGLAALVSFLNKLKNNQ